ncbi:restriction endonuclease subunit S [Nostoc flagelliforme FACHB-838]|uniref:Restriction endonuclease subunit S n=1 Tax=Nostoc flagelliforme FACHB-838 TaxID=2692904 RepID=A0ABR8DXH0_9NOSO|nr:restriction endonuclease subunit S [Nostoc flagelliforme]MBD2534025.1 restriction endonuclease subunit S [Nostoc flagelliforme FACHB-838]
MKSGDILLVKSNGRVSLVGKTAVVSDVEEGYAGYLIRLRLNKSIIDPIYLHLCLSSAELRLQIEIPVKSTSGVHNINSQEVKKLRIPLPLLEEQKEIVQRIQLFFKAIIQIENQYQNTNTKLTRLNQSILAKAFRGELVPQDPDDEPASVLLERIRAERDKLNNSKPKSDRTSKRKSKTVEGQRVIPGLE